MNITSWIQTHWVDLGAIVGLIHLAIGIFGNLTGSKSLQGLDDLITNLLNTIFKKQTPPNA